MINKICHVNGIDIAVEELGKGNKGLVLLIHGLTSSHLGTHPAADWLAEEYFVVNYDARGHGESTKPESYTLEDHARDVIALIDYYGFEKATVMGMSMGSYIAAAAAILAPERVDKLVLAVTKGHGETSSTQRLLKSMGLTLDDVTQDQLMELLNNALWAPTTPRAYRDYYNKLEAAAASRLTNVQKLAVDAALAGFDLRPYYHRVTAKTLLIAGRHDGINPCEQAQEVADLIPGSKIVYLEESGHQALREEPLKYCRALMSFLAE